MKILTKIVLMFSLLLTGLTASTVEYENAYKLYKSGNYEISLEEFKVLANEKNDADAAYILGYMYEHGEGCEIDKAKSMQWYKRSSNTYYKRDKHKVDKETFAATDDLLESLSEIEDPETKKTVYQYVHSVFNIKAHETNYLLPMSYRLNGNYDKNTERDTDSSEIEFQISVKYDFAPNLLGLGEIYTVAYTQHSFWQYFVGDAYFRASDYNPEIFITVPMNTEYFKAIRFSVEHKSNGLGVPYERSWNYLTLSSYFQYKIIFTELQVWHRMEDGYDYNPEMLDTMGYGHIKFTVPYKKHLASVLLRNNFAGKGAIDASYSYPLFGDSLFFYVKGFLGYGESMISYAGNPVNSDGTPNLENTQDDYVEKIGFGFSLSR